MDDFNRLFEHFPQYRIIVCSECRFAPIPSQVKRHLASHHPRLLPDQRRAILESIQSLPDLAHVESDVIYPKPRDAPVAGLPVFHDGSRCRAKLSGGRRCRYVCRTDRGIRGHCKDVHGWTSPSKRGGNVRSRQSTSETRLWQNSRTCQRFFKVGSWQRYFEVSAIGSPISNETMKEQKDQFFQQQYDEVQSAEQSVTDAANRVEGFDDHRSAVIPWLRTTGIVDHLQGLKKDEIQAAIALPVDDEDQVLQRLLQSMEAILQEAHSWCFDGPECMLTWPCRVVLSRFQSAQVEVLGGTRAFDPRKQHNTLKTYFKLPKQFLAYFRRVAAGRDYHFSADSERDGSRPEDSIDLTAEQLQRWQAIMRLARLQETQPDTASEDDLRENLVQLWMLLITHKTGNRRYRSPLLSFCAMLSIKHSTSSWMEPGNFNSNLSALVWVVQLLIFYDSARKERQGCGETLQLVKQRCEQCLQQTTDTPMGEILRWRLLLFKISSDSVSTHQATWDENEEVLKYEGIELHMSDISTLLLSEYRECRGLLREHLMFGANGVRHVHAWDLKDNMNVQAVGWNFSQHRDNAALLRGTEKTLLSSIEKSTHLCKLFVVQTGGNRGGLTWRESAIASYEASVQRFLERLIVLMHIESGTPLRESELFSVTWRNTQRNRSIYMHLLRLMIHTTYDKLQQQRGTFRDNIRFLSQPVADLLLDYLVYVIPLRQVFARYSSPGAILSPYLWAKDGKVWPNNKLSRFLENACDRAEIPRLHIANWRQMTVAMVKTKFAAQIGCFEIDPDDEDAEEIDDDIRILTKMRNHKTRTVNRAYANQTGASFGNVWDGLIRMGLRASTLWQDFWGLSVMIQSRKRSREEVETPGLTKRIAMGVYRPRKPWSTEALLGGLRKLYNDESLEWKSAEQAQALTLVMSWTEQVVIVLPTNAGKSAIFMLPCTLPDAGITILIVPLVSLCCDLLRRLKELGIDHLEWRPGERRDAALLLVSVEAASTKDFLTYTQTLIDQQKLDRIVFEESHLLVTAASYRDRIVDVTAIRELRTQFVYLTATLPPSLCSEFDERNHLLHPKMIRASSNRPNIFYDIQKARSGEGSLLQQAAGLARAMYRNPAGFDAMQDKIILYVRTRDEAHELADMLMCPAYTAKIGTADLKNEVVADWIQSTSQPCIVATAAFAEGFDYAHVRVVINVNEPDSLVLFAQQSGRGGRDGRRADSIILLPAKWQATDIVDAEVEGMQQSAIRDAGLGKQREKQAMHRYLRGEQCFRTSLTDYLDPACYRRWCMVGDVPCAVCKECHQEPIPARPPVQKKYIGEERFTGAACIRRSRRDEYSELARFQEDLIAVRGTCLLCRGLGQQWDHTFSSCSRRHEMFKARDRARRRHEQRRRRWIAPYTACFWCLNPQLVCSRADPELGREAQHCEDKDVVLPLCYGIFHSLSGPRWLEERFGRRFNDIDAFFDWLGEESQFGGVKAIQAVRVAAERLREFWLF